MRHQFLSSTAAIVVVAQTRDTLFYPTKTEQALTCLHAVDTLKPDKNAD